MTAVTRPRGPLPARVYWTRRLLLLVVPLVLVFVIGRLLGSGGSTGGASARTVGAPASTSTAASSTATPTPTVSPTTSITMTPSPAVSASPTGTGTRTARSGAKGAAKAAAPVPAPTGPCASSDVLAVPSVRGPAFATQPVTLALTLNTKTSPACTWTVSPSSLAVKITSGTDRVWSTQECVSAVPRQAVVVRKATPTLVLVRWNGQRSDPQCSRSTSWAQPGSYHAIAASLGGDPTDLQFPLTTRPRATVTKAPKPTAQPSGRASAGPRATSTARARAARPSATASPTHR